MDERALAVFTTLEATERLPPLVELTWHSMLRNSSFPAAAPGERWRIDLDRWHYDTHTNAEAHATAAINRPTSLSSGATDDSGETLKDALERLVRKGWLDRQFRRDWRMRDLERRGLSLKDIQQEFVEQFIQRVPPLRHHVKCWTVYIKASIACYKVDLYRRLARARKGMQETISFNSESELIDYVNTSHGNHTKLMDGETPDQHISVQDALEVLGKAMQALPPGRRAIIERRIRGIPYGEIAKELGIAESTVANQVRMAVRALQDALREAETPKSPPKGDRDGTL
jgi:RNA polymerase sigma factor (sigma-70 family)